MPTIADVIRFENALTGSKNLIYGDTSEWDRINKLVQNLENAMQEDFKSDIAGIKKLPVTTKLGPKAEQAFKQAQQGNCFGDPLSEMKATAPRMDDMIHEWMEIAKQKKATHIVAGNDSFDYEDYPVFVFSEQQAAQEKKKMETQGGVYFVKIVKVN